MTNGGWSPRMETMIGFGLVSTDVVVGDQVIVLRGGLPESGKICGLPFY